jgi:hypothetical protein
MTDNQNQQYIRYTKMAWKIYALIAIVLVVVLVLFVARDNEERFFYGFITIAGSYVFRPTNRYIDSLIFKFTGVTNGKENE